MGIDIAPGEEQNVVDLFEDYENWPPELTAVFDKYSEEAAGGFDYDTLAALLKEVQEIGYTFDYYLDAEPYNLRKTI